MDKEVVLALFGTIFAVIAVWFIYVGLGIDPTAPALMHIQLLDILIGVGAAVVSTLFWIGAAIVSASKG